MSAEPLAGKVAFVAGASRGIGRDIALGLAAAGASVAVAARSAEEGRLPGTIHSVAAAIEEQGGSALPVICDVSNEDSVNAAVARTVSVFGGIDVLVANAASLFMGSIVETPLSRWERVLGVNLTGVFLVTKAVVPHVIERGGGSLIALTTTGVRDTHLGSNAYWVSKAGVERLYAGLAVDLTPHNIAVNCLAPSKVVLSEGARASGMGEQVPPEFVEPGENLARAAVHLAQQDAGGLTGRTFYSLDLLETLGP